MAELQLDEHPGPVVVHNGRVLVPAGYQGLVVWEQASHELRQPGVDTLE